MKARYKALIILKSVTFFFNRVMERKYLDKKSLLSVDWVFFTVLVCAVLICYLTASDIFFIADDFLWLERGKYLGGQPLSMFKSEGLYFDPLVYLFFRINYILGGLNPLYYHVIDIVIHGLNAFLIFNLSRLLTKSDTAAIYSGLIFAVWPTNADAVLWPSARVDTLSAIFFLSAIISYIHYQKRAKALYYFISLISFITALFAKSAPILIPLVLVTLEIISNKIGCKAIFRRLIPFLIIPGVYLILLYLNSPHAIKAFEFDGLNTRELLRGITVLFFPESLIAANEKVFTVIAILCFLSLVGISGYTNLRTTTVICVILGIVVVPLLFMSISFVYATPSSPPRNLLGSICHRLYLASIGFSILMGTSTSICIQWVKKYGRFIYALLTVFLVIAIFIYGFTYVKQREGTWRSLSNKYIQYDRLVKNTTDSLSSKSNVSRIYMINFPIGFIEHMFRIYLNNGTLNYVRFAEYRQVPDLKLSDNKTVVLILGEEGKFIDITSDLFMYQTSVDRCNNTQDKNTCYKKLSIQYEYLNNINFITSTIYAYRYFAD